MVPYEYIAPSGIWSTEAEGRLLSVHNSISKPPRLDNFKNRFQIFILIPHSLLLFQHWKQNVWLAGLATPFLYLSVMGCLNLTIVLTLALKAGINAASYVPFLGLFLSSAFAFLSLTIFLAQKENKKWEGVPDEDEEKDQILKNSDNSLSYEEKGDVLVNQTWINP